MSGDKNLLKNYEDSKDLYATIGSMIFHTDYWNCMETFEDGTPNPEGKERRKKCKKIVLAVSYGMGPKLMSKDLGVSIDECKEYLDEFFKTFPAVKDFTKKNESDAKNIGYVQDYMGRRRHLKDASLPELSIRAYKDEYTSIDQFLDCSINDSKISVPDVEKANRWKKIWEEQYFGKGFEQKTAFKELAKKEGLDVLDNGAFISKTLTQCTNATIQGGAATLTKKAMVHIDSDPMLNKLGFRLMIPVHDELLGECPIENAEEASKRLCQLMVEAALPELTVKFKCDPYVVKHWYADEVHNIIREFYVKAKKKGREDQDIFNELFDTYEELSAEDIIEMCNNTFDNLGDI